MIKTGLEKFDSPIVIINQVYGGEDWGVVASYVSEQEARDMAGDDPVFVQVGWHLSVTLPNLDDVSYEQVFATPEAALEFGIEQIISGSLSSMESENARSEENAGRFGCYASFSHRFNRDASQQPS